MRFTVRSYRALGFPTSPALLLGGLLSLGLGSCDSGLSGGGGGSGDPCEPGQSRCIGKISETCQFGYFARNMACTNDQVCDDTLGCVACAPNSTVCIGQDVHQCTAQGTLDNAIQKSCGFNQLCQSGVCVDACEVQASEFVYLVDEAHDLLSFAPRMDTNPNSLKVIGQLKCPAMNNAFPFSMSVDRKAQAWVLYNSGEMFLVSTEDASCQKTTFTPNQMGFNLFGMGYVSDGAGAKTETLFIGGGPTAGSGTDSALGRVDPMSLAVTKVGLFPMADTSPELTGTSEAILYGYFPSNNAGKHFIAQLDRTTAQYGTVWQLPALPGPPRDWAFAHWGGRYYYFVTSNNVSQIYRYDPSTGMSTLVQDNLPYKIDGAGVSTCAPIKIG